jgi:hypothetical protein
MLVILVNRAVDPKRTIRKQKWRAKEGERHEGSPPPQKKNTCIIIILL